MIQQVTLEQLDKKLLPLTTAGLLQVRYSEAQSTTFYSAPSGRVVAMTRDGKHFAQVMA